MAESSHSDGVQDIPSPQLQLLTGYVSSSQLHPAPPLPQSIDIEDEEENLPLPIAAGDRGSCSSQADSQASDSASLHQNLPLSIGHLLDNTGRLPPAALNLTPCTLQQYLNLEIDDEKFYELVDGLLIWRSDMPPDSEHFTMCQLLHAIALHGSEENGKKTVCAYTCASMKVAEASVRLPDVAIVPCGSQGTSYGPTDQGKLLESGRLVPLLSIEITSPSNFRNDLYDKWHQYARAGVEEYMIVHRDKPTNNGSKRRRDPCVIVGSLRGSGSRMANGDPRSDSKAPEGQRMYYRKIFRGKQIVQCSIFSKLKLTANEMLNSKALEAIAEYHEERKVAAEKAMRKKAEASASKAQASASKAQASASKAQASASKAQASARSYKAQLGMSEEKVKEAGKKAKEADKKAKEAAKQRKNDAEKLKEAAKQRKNDAEKLKEADKKAKEADKKAKDEAEKRKKEKDKRKRDKLLAIQTLTSNQIEVPPGFLESSSSSSPTQSPDRQRLRRK